MDKNFTELIRDWLETPAAERDYTVGALYLLKLSGNQIMYRNVIADPKGKGQFIEYQIQKYYNFRVRELTHDQVKEMEQQVAAIVNDRMSLTEKKATAPEQRGKSCASREQTRAGLQSAERSQDSPKGKRTDHEQLPLEIQSLWVENLDLLHRMREVHLRLRMMSTEDSPCPDSERYPFLKELIELDKKMHNNYRIYDSFSGERRVESGEDKPTPKGRRKATKTKV